MKLTVNTAPSVEPVTAKDLRQELRLVLDDTTEDDHLNLLITSARNQVEAMTKRALIDTVFIYNLNRWPRGNRITLPIAPLDSVTHVKYTDTEDTQSTLSSDDYAVLTSGLFGEIVLNYGEVWPSDALNEQDPIEIQFTAGYGPAPSDVPEALRIAVRQMAAQWYINRVPVQIGAPVYEIPKTLDYLIAPYIAELPA